jgi:predicted metalloprotease with PDZ domain
MRALFTVFLAIGSTGCLAASEEPMHASTSTTEASATLGVATAIPSSELASELDLAFEIRQQGRVVETVDQWSVAARAGVEPGDVLLRLGDITLYSQDDIEDFLSVHDPGDEVRATVVRRGSREREELRLALGSGAPRESGKIRWQYASLAQLPAALDRARAEKKKVLVGLSGAET